MNNKYIKDDFYRKAMSEFKNKPFTDNDKELMANAVASICNRYPEIDHDAIFERLSELKEIDKSPIKDNKIDGLCCYSINTIKIDEKKLTSSERYAEVLTHELVHFISSPHKDYFNIHRWDKVNEVLTQAQAYKICDDLDIKTNASYKISNDDTTINIIAFGKCYGHINHVGMQLYYVFGEDTLSKMQFDNNPPIETMNLSFDNHLDVLNKALNNVQSKINEKEEIAALNNLTTCMYQIYLDKFLHSNDSIKDYLDTTRMLMLSSPNQVLGYKEPNITLQQEMQIGDVLAWAKCNNIELDKIGISMVDGLKPDKVDNFTKCFELLRQYPKEIKENDIYTLQYIKEENNIKVQAGTKIMTGTIDESGFVKSKFVPIKSTDYNFAGFTEKDLYNKQDFSFEDLKTSLDMSQNKNLALYYLLGDSCKTIEEIDAMASKTALRPSLHSYLQTEESFRENMDIDNLYASVRRLRIDGNCGMPQLLESREYDLAIQLLADDYSINNNGSLSYNIDIDKASIIHDKNLLCMLIDKENTDGGVISTSDLNKIIKKINGDIYKTYGNESLVTYIASMDDNERKEELSNWLVKKPLKKDDLNRTIILSDGSESTVLRELMNYADIYKARDLLWVSETHTNDFFGEKKLFNSLIEHNSQTSLKNAQSLIDSKVDVNYQDENNELPLKRAIKNLEINSTNRIENLILIKDLITHGADTNIIVDETSGITVGNLLAKIEDSYFLTLLITDTQLKYEDIFNESIPKEWIDKFSKKDLEEMLNISNSTENKETIIETAAISL